MFGDIEAIISFLFVLFFTFLQGEKLVLRRIVIRLDECFSITTLAVEWRLIRIREIVSGKRILEDP